MKDSQRKAMFAKKQNIFQLGDEVVRNVDSRLYKIPARSIKGERLERFKVINIKNVKFPKGAKYDASGKETGMIMITVRNAKGDRESIGGLGSFTKYHPNSKYKVHQNGRVEVVA